jgi:2-dehydropantoate 2-reductase
MRILVYGAGVLGSLYAARLHEAGHDVTLLARGSRLTELEEHGVVLEHVTTCTRTVTHVPLTTELRPEEVYDLILVLMRKNQVGEILPALAANEGTPSVLFMTNNAAGPDAYVNALGRERVLMGFPGAGGERVEGVVRYVGVAEDDAPTTVGELDGAITPRLNAIVGAFESAGLPVDVSLDIDAWLKTHVAIVSPIASALYMADGDVYRLARTRDALVLLVRGVREGFRVLRALQLPITPSRYRLVAWIPEPLLVAWLRRFLGSEFGELALQAHANAARDEMAWLAREFKELAREAGVETPVLDVLGAHAEPTSLPALDGSAELPVDWSAVWGALSVVATLLGLTLLLRRKRR